MSATRDSKQKTAKQIREANVLESLKTIGGGTTKSIKEDLFENTGKDFFNQFFGAIPEKKYSGDIIPGESLEISEVYSGKIEENKKLKQQISLERKLSQEEKSLIENKSNQLRVQLQTMSQEVVSLALATQTLEEEVQIAAMEVPANPGAYHLVFFEKLLEFIKSFRRKIESSSVWLHATNKRAEKKNYWNMYKKKGSSFLLAPDHYLQRSAG